MRTDDGFLDITKLLEPRSVAVVGASDRPGNFGGATVRRLVRFGFAGPVWPVNRTGAAVAGVRAFTSLTELPGVPDLAILAVPADSLLETVHDCVRHGIRAGIAYAGGLGEAGGAGADRQRELVELCRREGFVLCGPNCVGIINTALPVTATFATALEEIGALPAGAISMVSQSGGIGTTAFSLALAAGFAFRTLISSGNEAVVDFSDYLFALARDEGTRVVAGYLEGLVDGPRFVRALEECRRQGKPVVLIKAGATTASARAARAHTGALVGEDRVFDAVMRELGVVRVNSVEELVDVAALLVGAPRASCGRGVGIVTFGGGNGVLAADQCARHGLAAPPLSDACVARLKPLLATVATAANPVDLTPTTAFREEFLSQLPAALDVVAAEPAIDALLFIVGTLAAKAGEIIEVTRTFASRAPKPVVVSWPSPPAGVRERLGSHGIYMFDEPDDALRAVARLAARGPAGERAPGAPERIPAGFSWERFVPHATASSLIPEHRCHEILRAAGLPVAEGELARDAEHAVRIASRIGLPVALKGISPAVTHRAAAGLVVLGVGDADAVRAGVRRIVEQASGRSIALEGVYVQKMHPRGIELLVSAFVDPVFGPMVSCGSGGGLTELLDDVVTARAPVDRAGAAGMIDRLRIRGHAADAQGPLPTGEVATFLASLSSLAAVAPWRRCTFEVNPLEWTREGVVAVDGLLVIDEA